MKQFMLLMTALFVTCIYSCHLFAQEYAIVVNAANNYNASQDIMRQEIKRLFLKQKADWHKGVSTKAKPMGPLPASPAHEAFLYRILEMSTAQLAQHWLRAKQVSGQTPPRELKSRLAIKLVGRNEGAFTVLSTEETADLPNTVKVLFTF